MAVVDVCLRDWRGDLLAALHKIPAALKSSNNQAPSSREIPNPKLQIRDELLDLRFGAWSFSGCWSLEFGAYPLRYGNNFPTNPLIVFPSARPATLA
jgi:hypothetical protein